MDMSLTLICKPYDYRLYDANGIQVGGSFTSIVSAQVFANRLGRLIK